MPTLYNSKHRSWTTLNNGGSLSSGGVSVTVLSAASLPAAPFVATIEPGVSGQEEVIAVTGVASNTLTIVRGLDGTTGVSHPDGCIIKNLSSSLAWSDMISLFKSHTHAGDGNTSLLPNYYSPRNALPNGGFEGWQRGTSFAAIASATYFADTWQYVKVGTGVVTIAQDTSVPAVGTNAISTPYSCLVTPTTADTAIAAGDQYALSTVVEGYDYRALANGFAVSLWVKAHLTGTYCVAFRNSGVDRSYIAEIVVLSADTWEYKTFIVPGPPSGTWNLTNGIGMRVTVALAMGSTQQSTANTWNSNGAMATSNQVNGVGLVTDVFSIWGLNIVPGTVPQPYQPMPFALQWTRLERYYEVLGGVSVSMICRGYGGVGAVVEQYYIFHTKKGGTPTVTKLGTWTLTNLNGQPAVEGQSPDGFSLWAVVTALGSANFYCADATCFVTSEWNPS